MLNRIGWSKESIFDILSLILLILFLVFVLGFVISHGICCGDDASLAINAKMIAKGNYQNVSFGFDPHLMVILPTALGILVFGNTYWIPGLSVLLINFIFLIIIGTLLRRFQKGIWFTVASTLFLLFSYLLTTKHFEQWFSALGEIPAALLLFSAVLLFFQSKSIIHGFFSGVLFSLAFLTKVVTFIALGAFLISLLVQSIIRKVNDKHTAPYFPLGKILALIVGFLIPWVIFVVIITFYLETDIHFLRWIENITYIKEFLGNYKVKGLLEGFSSKATYFKDRFNVSFPSLTGLLLLAGWMVQQDEKLKKVFYVSLSIFLFYSYWWFYFTYPLGRYYIVPLIIIIFMLIFPILSSRKTKWRLGYVLILILWSVFTWQNVSVPFQKVDGSYFKPTDRTRSLLYVSRILSEREDQYPIITKKGVTIGDIQYISERELMFARFNSQSQYNPPFWIAVTTDFVGLNERFLKYSDADTWAFKKFISKCDGLRQYDDYLVGRCE